MAEHDEHSSFIKTPQQLITVVLLAFVVPIFGIVHAGATGGEPAARGSLGAHAGSGGRAHPAGRQGRVRRRGRRSAAAKSGEDIVKEVCGACHVPGVANAPKIGDKAAWAPRLKLGLDGLLQSVVKGKGAMPPRAGTSLTDAGTRARDRVHGQPGRRQPEGARRSPPPKK